MAYIRAAASVVRANRRTGDVTFTGLPYNADTVCAALALRARVAIRAFRLFADFGITDLSFRAVCVFHAVNRIPFNAATVCAVLLRTAVVVICAFRRFAGTGHADLSVRAVGIFHAPGWAEFTGAAFATNHALFTICVIGTSEFHEFFGFR